MQTPVHEIDDSFAFYKIAFQWYPLIGVIAMWVPAIIISFLTGGQDFTDFNIQLLSPCVQNLVPRKYRHTELKAIRSLIKSVSQRGEDEKDPIETATWISKNDE